jgi:hypothetical protein
VDLSVFHKIFQNLELCPPFSGDTVSVTVPAGQAITIVKKKVLVTEDVGHSVVPQIKRNRSK